jgi:hypothetical protein
MNPNQLIADYLCAGKTRFPPYFPASFSFQFLSLLSSLARSQTGLGQRCARCASRPRNATVKHHIDCCPSPFWRDFRALRGCGSWQSSGSMEAVLDFLLMPLLGLVSAALCIGILFCLNHIANGYSPPPFNNLA